MPISAVDDWQRCKPWIAAALSQAPDLESIESVERKISDGTYQFWAGDDAAAITQIIEANGVKILMLRHAGGSMEALTEKLEPMLCEFGRFHGCKRIMGEGREGWQRVTKKMGYRFGFCIMVKDL